MAASFDKIIQLMIVMQLLRSFGSAQQAGAASIKFPDKITINVPELQSIVQRYDEIAQRLDEYVDVLDKLRNARYIEIVERKYRYVTLGKVNVNARPVIVKTHTYVKPFAISVGTKVVKSNVTVQPFTISVSVIKQQQ